MIVLVPADEAMRSAIIVSVIKEKSSMYVLGKCRISVRFECSCPVQFKFLPWLRRRRFVEIYRKPYLSIHRCDMYILIRFLDAHASIRPPFPTHPSTPLSNIYDTMHPVRVRDHDRMDMYLKPRSYSLGLNRSGSTLVTLSVSSARLSYQSSPPSPAL